MGSAAGRVPSLAIQLLLGFRRLVRAADALAVRKGYFNLSDLATWYFQAGEKDKALEWLEKGFEIQGNNLPYLGTPMYESLGSDPRFQDLMRHMNFPP